MSGPVILVLAAGQSARMRGADKLAEPVGGVPLLRRQALAALGAGVPVMVALPVPEGSRGALLDGLGVVRVAVADAALGMGHSIAAGARAALARGAGGLMVLNADLPGLGSAEIARVIGAFAADPGRIHRGTTADGRPGHPVLFPARLLPELARLTGDAGAREIVAREGAVPVPLPGDAALRDLDTPEDWAAWRSETGL